MFNLSGEETPSNRSQAQFRDRSPTLSQIQENKSTPIKEVPSESSAKVSGALAVVQAQPTTTTDKVDQLNTI